MNDRDGFIALLLNIYFLVIDGISIWNVFYTNIFLCSIFLHTDIYKEKNCIKFKTKLITKLINKGMNEPMNKRMNAQAHKRTN